MEPTSVQNVSQEASKTLFEQGWRWKLFSDTFFDYFWSQHGSNFVMFSMFLGIAFACAFPLLSGRLSVQVFPAALFLQLHAKRAHTRNMQYLPHENVFLKVRARAAAASNSIKSNEHISENRTQRVIFNHFF